MTLTAMSESIVAHETRIKGVEDDQARIDSKLDKLIFGMFFAALSALGTLALQIFKPHG